MIIMPADNASSSATSDRDRFAYLFELAFTSNLTNLGIEAEITAGIRVRRFFY